MKTVIQIGYLLDYPHFADEVAGLWHKEWGNVSDEADLAHKRLSVERKMNKGKVPYVLVAMIDKELAGSVAVFENDMENRPEITPWLAAVVTKKKFRGLGVAEILVKTVLSECRKLGYERIYLRTEEADGYFSRLGWTLLEATKDENGKPTRIYEINIGTI